jgi:hypothetical protein
MLVDAGQRLVQVDRDSLGETCGEAQYSLLDVGQGRSPAESALVAASHPAMRMALSLALSPRKMKRLVKSPVNEGAVRDEQSGAGFERVEAAAQARSAVARLFVVIAALTSAVLHRGLRNRAAVLRRADVAALTSAALHRGIFCFERAMLIAARTSPSFIGFGDGALCGIAESSPKETAELVSA